MSVVKSILIGQLVLAQCYGRSSRLVRMLFGLLALPVLF
jgi:hypothetical protein